MRSFVFSMTLALSTFVTSEIAIADEPQYSLDILPQHPYRFVPAYGHASQNPGSPKWFRPGYGYQIPGFGYSLRTPVRQAFYHYQVPRTTADVHYYWDQGRSPWYLPGASYSDSTLTTW